MIQTLHDTGATKQITSKMDGGTYQTATEDCVVGGVGDHFALTQSGLSVSMTSGNEAVIGGSFFKMMSAQSVELTANTEQYLCATIDTSRANGDRGIFTLRTSASITRENINGSGSVRDLPLYKITTGSNSITSIEDLRPITYKRPHIYWGTSEPANTLGENGDLYIYY